MKTLEQELADLTRKAVVKLFSDSSSLFVPDYANRIKIPADFVARVYALIDYDQVLVLLAPKINEVVADRVAAALTQELTTDVKKILSDESTRFRLRAAVLGVLDK